MNDRMSKNRKLKTVAVVLALITFLAALLCVYLLANAHLTVIAKSRAEYSAEEFQEGQAFASLQVYMEENAVPGIVFRNETLGDPDQYRFAVYTLRLRNNDLISAETVECRILPQEDDILMYAADDETIIPGGQERDVRVVLLTREGSGNVRDIRVSCYYWGHREEMTFTYAP